MPYIKQEDRKILQPVLDAFKEIQVTYKHMDRAISMMSSHKSGEHPGVGDMNYLITQMLLQTKPQKYADYNAIIGMLECCKLEFYRKAVSVYEDEKIKENGDVYPDNK